MVLMESRDRASGVEASLKSRSDAAPVVLSCVLRLRMQDTSTLKGSRSRVAKDSSQGSCRVLTCFLSIGQALINSLTVITRARVSSSRTGWGPLFLPLGILSALIHSFRTFHRLFHCFGNSSRSYEMERPIPRLFSRSLTSSYG